MFRVIFLLCLILLQSCATNTVVPSKSVNIAKNVALQLSQPTPQWQNQGLLTLVKGKHGENDYELLVQVEMTAQRIVMVGTTVNGIELFELVWQQDKPYHLRKSPLAQSIEVAYLLADFQLVHWPLPQLQQRLLGAVIAINGNVRSITRGNKLLVRIESQTQQTRFEHFERDYQLTLKVLEKWHL